MTDKDNKSLILREYIKTYTTLKGLIVSDRDGVPLYFAFAVPETEQKYKQMAGMLNAMAHQNSENLRKLVPSQKTNSITMTFEGLTFHIQNWKQLVLSVFAHEFTSMPLIKEMAEELQGVFGKLDEAAFQYALSKK